MPAFQLSMIPVYDNTGVLSTGGSGHNSDEFGAAGWAVLGVFLSGTGTPAWNNMDIRLKSDSPIGGFDFIEDSSGNTLRIDNIQPAAANISRFFYFGYPDNVETRVLDFPTIITASSLLNISLGTASGSDDRIRLWAVAGPYF